MHKVLVGGQQRQLVAYAKLGKQGIDGSDLYARPATGVSDPCRSHMIIPIRLYEWKGSEPLNDLRLRLGSREAL